MGKVTWGQGEMHGRDAVAPLPNLIQGTWGTPLRGQGDMGTWGQGERQRCTDATQSRPYLRRILKPIKGKGFGVGIIIVRLILC